MLFFNKKSNKPTIVAIHGFGVRGVDEFEKLRIAVEKKGYTFKSVQLYDLEDPSDTDWASWISKAKSLITEVAHDSNIILIGFSMGGVIASYLANSYKVKKLVLLSPAFEYLNINTIIDHMPKPFVKGEIVKSRMPVGFTSTFMDVINNCKNSISNIRVPTLIIHCEKDETIPLSSSIKNFKKIPINNKALLSISNGQHRVLDDKIAGPIAISNIISFIENEYLK